MQIDVLGTLDVRENGVSIAPTAPKPRQVLALLALHADRVVPVAALVDELWSGRPPRSVRTTLQTYVLQLRELITLALHQPAAPADAASPCAGRSAKDVLATVPGGYLLVSGGGGSDVREFERLAGLGYRAMDAGDHKDASRLLREALLLWTGPAFAGVPAGARLETEARRLEESRLCALDQRIEADLRLGRHRELLAELTVLTSRYATHENLHAQFMLALHRSGRRGEALDVYHRLRATLVRDLGLEPSPRLRRLQQSILVAAPETPPSAPRQAVPAVPVLPAARARVGVRPV
ncbi:AfsR/SARP family transcriptional regulator [Streptomyces sp. NBC_01239]|uniref:AfsR/SARP family transcriptional regulator n=1 Tax=Streptomyces sp. NBC_01239 TaxID=2903792 RepID=UPI00225C25FA|nr:AfsR/SARP family transcriptional regulator [Streptomyces sp. NBC_01239]MCX4816688.1 AfsR/SARP family transcriptional regulator [Streptomyces sp. NBC_01239]MCX4818077.1 AfsR/SARP family transcriptional regulator [Streptomyces sp. NBC_01239]MCX4818267.1 AfsR/SARP family transcriptional regulator [Streptomyces sp. NBC_01239]